MPLGYPFKLVLTYDPRSYTFRGLFNVESMSSYTFPSEEIFFKDVIITGDIQMTYVGFPWNGVCFISKLHWAKPLHKYPLTTTVDENPAVPVGTIIRYVCPPGHKLDHDWYAPTIVNIECTELGSFSQPEFWGKCVIRKHCEPNLEFASLQLCILIANSSSGSSGSVSNWELQ